MSDTTRDIFTILGKVFNEGRRYELPEAWSYDLDKCMSPREAEKAINEYIAQQVKEARIKELEQQLSWVEQCNPDIAFNLENSIATLKNSIATLKGDDK
jgi:hypothetical protein